METVAQGCSIKNVFFKVSQRKIPVRHRCFDDFLWILRNKEHLFYSTCANDFFRGELPISVFVCILKQKYHPSPTSCYLPHFKILDKIGSFLKMFDVSNTFDSKCTFDLFFWLAFVLFFCGFQQKVERSRKN